MGVFLGAAVTTPLALTLFVFSVVDSHLYHAFIAEGAGTTARLFREGENVRLRAENGEHKDIVASAEDVEVQGRVELILRRPWRR